jgi:hypothetical protein
MRSIMVALLVLFPAVASAQDWLDTTQVEIIVDPSLPDGVLARTACTKDNKPAIIFKSERPAKATVVHELVHVHQAIRDGKGCHYGYKQITASAAALLAAEAEAYCFEADWTRRTMGSAPEVMLRMAEYYVWEASSGMTDKSWWLTQEQVHAAFLLACHPYSEIFPAPGLTTVKPTPDQLYAVDPLTYRLRKVWGS